MMFNSTDECNLVALRFIHVLENRRFLNYLLLLKFPYSYRFKVTKGTKCFKGM